MFTLCTLYGIVYMGEVQELLRQGGVFMEAEKLKGVLTTNSDGFELFTHNHRTNLTYKLKLIWQEAIPVKIKIDDEYTTVFYL